MEQRIVKLQISNEYITGSGVSVGAVGSHDDVLLEMDFRPSAVWAGTTRRAIFANALGENRTVIVLTTNLLEEGQGEIYLVPVPQEAKDVSGECFLTVEGFVTDSSGKEIVRCVTEEARFRVLPSKLYTNDSDPVTPSQAEQLQAEIDSIKSDIVEVKGAREATAASQAAAAASEAAAKESEMAAGASKEAAAESAAQATAQADAAAESAASAASARAAAETAQGKSEDARAAAESARLAAAESAAAAQASETAAKSAREAAAASEGAAAGSEESARDYANQAAASAAFADACKCAASVSEGNAKGSETNAEYWAKQAEQIVGGDFATKQEAQGYVGAHNDSETAHGDIRQTLANHVASDENPHNVKKEQVGLGNVDNTSDADKPVSTYQQAELDKKAALTHAAQHASGGTDPITPASIGADASGSAAAVQANLNAHAGRTDNPHGVTAAQVGAATTTTLSCTVPVKWTASGSYFYQQVTVSGMLAADNPVADILPGTDNDANKLYAEAWSKVQSIDTLKNAVKFWCTEAPTTAFPVQFKVVR